jgi:DNA replication protein DnaC
MTDLHNVNNSIQSPINQLQKESDMPQINTTNNQPITAINQSQEGSKMSNNYTDTQPDNANIDGAKKIASLAIWNGQLLGAERMVKRALRYRGIKPTGTLLCGGPGTGKTHFATKLREELTARTVTRGDHRTMPVVMISAPQQSSVHNMVEKLLHELGDIDPSKGKYNDKLNRLFSLLIELEVELIIVDEIHDYLPKRGVKKHSTALSFLKGLMDETLIPILFMGTEQARLLNTMNEELGSRLRYLYTFTKISYGSDESSKTDFAEMASAFGENLPRKVNALNFVTFNEGGPTFSNTNLLDRLYVATDGLPRGLRDIFLEINLEMEDNPKFSPSLNVLASIYEGLEMMNNYIDFNPFDENSLDNVRKYISQPTVAKGAKYAAA